LAIAALVLSIIWLAGLGSLMAIIFGAVALAQIRSSQDRHRGRGLAVAGVILGVFGLLATTALVAWGHTDRSHLAPTPQRFAPASPTDLAQANLALSDFPKLPAYAPGWTSSPYLDTTIFGDESIAHVFSVCLGLQSSLLGTDEPGVRAASPVFRSELSTVESLVAVEPSVTTATAVVRQSDGIKASTCVDRQLTAGWRRFSNAGVGAVGPAPSDYTVSVAPVTLGRAGDQSTAFSYDFNYSGLVAVDLFDDVVLVRQGRTDALLTFTGYGSPLETQLERSLERTIVRHLRLVALNGAPTEPPTG
jgi:hypothetical protein